MCGLVTNTVVVKIAWAKNYLFTVSFYIGKAAKLLRKKEVHFIYAISHSNRDFHLALIHLLVQII